MSKIIIQYPFDLKGTNTGNATRHTVSMGTGQTNRAFAYPTGPFFADTFRLAEVSKPNITLERGKDYQLILLHPELTKLAGREIATAVVVFNPAISTDVLATAQVVGGPYAANVDAIEQALNALAIDNRTIDFTTLSDVPDEYQAAPAYSDIGDVFGFEYVISVMGNIADAIKVGDNAEMINIRKSIEEMRTALNNRITEHVNSQGNVHTVTRAQLSVLSSTEVNTLIQGVRADVSKLATRVGSCEGVDQNLDSKITAINDAIATYNQQLTQIRQNYQRRGNEIAELTNDIAEYDTQVGNLTQLLNQTRQELADANLVISKQRLDINTNAQAITDLQQALENVKQDVTGLDGTMEDHVAADDPHPKYVHKDKGGTIEASVHVTGNLTSGDDVIADSAAPA